MPNQKMICDAAMAFDAAAKRSGRITESQARRLFAPADTLGANAEHKLACDAALQDAGIFGLIQHSVNLGQMPLITFLGYAALQQIQQNSLIRTLIQVPARDMMAAGFDLQVDRRDDGDLLDMVDPDELKEQDAKTVSLIQDKWQAHDLDRKLRLALEMDGYEGGAFIFIDTGTQENDLRLPLNISRHSIELQRDRPLKFKLIDPINCYPGTYNSAQPLADHYFEPQTWWVLGTEVHCSRLIRFACNEVPTLLKPAYNFLGLPQAQLYWDYVMHWNQNRDSANRLLNKFSLIAFKTNMGDALNGGMIDDLNRRIDYLASKRSNDGILLMDKELEDIVNVTTPLAGVTDIVKQSLEWLAVVSHIPAVVLFGQSPSGFNATGESDLTNYSNLIESRREGELRRPIERLCQILRIRYTGCEQSVKITFRPFDTSKSQQNAQTELTKAQIAATHIQAGLTSAEEERQKLAQDRDSGYQFIVVDDVPGEQDSMPDELMGGINEQTEGQGAEGSAPEPGHAGGPEQAN